MKKDTTYKHKIRAAIKALLVAILTFSWVTASALDVSYYAQSSKLSSGKWVKIKTSGEGIHEITYDQLRSWGFQRPEKVNVYGYGATLLAVDKFDTSHPDDVSLTYTHHEGDKLYFYSTGDVTATLRQPADVVTNRNYYSTEVFYLLSDRHVSETETIPAAGFAESDVVYDVHRSLYYLEEELQNPSMVGGYFLGRNVTEKDSLYIPITIKNMGTGAHQWEGAATLMINYGALNRNAETNIKVGIPNLIKSYSAGDKKAVAKDEDAYTRYKLGYKTVHFEDILPDSTYVFMAIHPQTGETFLALDYAWLVYTRLNRMDDDAQLSMYFPSLSTGTNFSISGSPTVRVVNVTNPEAVYGHTIQYDTENGILTGSFDRNYTTSTMPSCHLVAYDTEKTQLGVEFVEELANQDMHAAQTPDMIIITTMELMDAAEELAEAHRKYDNMDVLVVEHTALFNEFSAATPDVMGYRRFIKMLYDRNPEKLKYVILYGPSVWDNRHIIKDKKSRLLTYETLNPVYSGNVTTAFGTDCYFGMLSDKYDPAQITRTTQTIAVGRIPVSDSGQGRAVNRKVINYIENLPSSKIYNTVLVMSDDGDNNTHLSQAEVLADNLLKSHDAMTVVRAHNSIYQWDGMDAKILRNVATDALKQGAGMFAYVGHGSEDAFGREKLWSRSFARSTSYDLFPIGLFASCTNYAYDLDKDNLGQEMILKENGGLIAVIAAARTVYGSLNQALAKSVIDSYTSANHETTIGKIWIDARNNIIGKIGYTEDYQVNTMCFNLGGDPALRVPASSYQVNISSVTDAEGNTPTVIEPFTTLTVEGSIVNADSEIIEDFDGTVTVQIFDTPYQVSTLLRNKDDLDKKITLDQDVLMSQTVNVTSGRFKTTIVTPVPIHEGSNKNRMVFYADANDGRRADGLYKNIQLKAPDGEIEAMSNEGPSINNIAVNEIGNGDGSVVGNEVNLLAQGTVSGLGLCTSSGMRATSSLVIDGTRQIAGIKEAIHLDEDFNWTLSIPVRELEDGPHYAVLTVADNAGQSTSESINFVVGADNSVELTADVSTVRDEITFDINHTLGDITEANLVIEDRKGNAVISRQEVSFPCTLNLSENDSMNDGHYKAYVQLTGTSGKGSSQRVPFVLLKK